MTNGTVTQFSQDAAKQAAIEANKEKLREEGRAEWRPQIAGAVEAAVKAALAPSEKRFTETVTEMRAHHKEHIKAVAQARLWLGACMGIVIGSLAASAGIAYVFKDAQMTNAAARGIEQRGGASVLPAPTLCDPAVEQCLPDTNNRDTGYDRPGGAP